MAYQLAEVSKRVQPGRHAALLLDQAGWDTSTKLDVPANITIVPLPPKCPELNPQENVWQFLRGQLALKPRVRLLRRSGRPLLRRLEPPGRPALDHHVARNTSWGARVMIRKSWYYPQACLRPRRLRKATN